MNQLYFQIRMAITIERHHWLFEHTSRSIRMGRRWLLVGVDDLLLKRYGNGARRYE